MNKISCALPPETKCQLSMYMILPIVMKCSLTAQNVFTCSAWRHVLVLYTVAIVKIFFFTVGINNNRYRCHTTLSGFFCFFCKCSLSFSLFKFAHHDISIFYSFLSICASKGEVWKSITWICQWKNNAGKNPTKQVRLICIHVCTIK